MLSKDALGQDGLIGVLPDTLCFLGRQPRSSFNQSVGTYNLDKIYLKTKQRYCTRSQSTFIHVPGTAVPRQSQTNLFLDHCAMKAGRSGHIAFPYFLRVECQLVVEFEKLRQLLISVADLIQKVETACSM